MTTQEETWRSLLEDVQKYILTKPIGTSLYVSEEVFSFFAKDSSRPRKKANNTPLAEPAYIPKPVKFTPPIQSTPPKEKTPIIKPLDEIPEEKLKGSTIPTYDYKQIKDLMGTLKPGLTILEEPKINPCCILFGTSLDNEMMDNIKKAIIENLKKNAHVIISSESLTDDECKALFSDKNVQLSIITGELLEINPALAALFKAAEPMNYLSGVQALKTATFRALKDNPGEKRVLWNSIKSIL